MGGVRSRSVALRANRFLDIDGALHFTAKHPTRAIGLRPRYAIALGGIS
ncbi:MAG: hypothetical protein F6K56_37465 [Moorea sp. SIO3G5]|nr:hypothetical protein [Moorena sp. SIO3G5]